MTAELSRGKSTAARRGLAGICALLLAVLTVDGFLWAREKEARREEADAIAAVGEIQGMVAAEEFQAGLRHLHWLRELTGGEGAEADRIEDEVAIGQFVEKLRERHRLRFKNGTVNPARHAGPAWTDYTVDFTVEGVSLPALTDFLLEIERVRRLKVSGLDLTRKDAEGALWEAKVTLTLRKD